MSVTQFLKKNPFEGGVTRFYHKDGKFIKAYFENANYANFEANLVDLQEGSMLGWMIDIASGDIIYVLSALGNGVIMASTNLINQSVDQHYKEFKVDLVDFDKIDSEIEEER